MFYQRNTNGVNQIGQKENLLKLKTNVLKLIEKFRSPHAFIRSLLKWEIKCLWSNIASELFLFDSGV